MIWLRRTVVSCALCGVLYSCGGPESARDVLREARVAMLGEAARVPDVTSTAVVMGPRGPLVTTVYSDASGKVRMEQSNGFMAALDDGAGWYLRGDSAWRGLDAARLGYLRGHELHMIALAPETRFGTPELLEDMMFAGERSIALRFPGFADEPVYVFYNPETMLPRGFLIDYVEPGVEVTLGEWRTSDDVTLFHQATFNQGGEIYRYTFNLVDLGELADSVFAIPHSVADSISR